MTTTLGPLAVYHILAFTEQDFRRRRKNLKNAVRVPQVGLMARHVSWKWAHIWELYFAGDPRQSLDYLRSPELLLQLNTVLDYGDVRAIFGHGKPMRFHNDIPLRLVSKLVEVVIEQQNISMACFPHTFFEAFQRLREEPSSLYIFITVPYAFPIRRCGRSAASAPPEPVVKDLAGIWPEVYSSHLPCAKCTSMECAFDATSVMLRPGKCSRQSKCYVTEMFHVPSKHFQTELTVELHFACEEPKKYEYEDLQVRPSTSGKLKKTELCQVLVYLDDGTCGRGLTSQAQSGAARKIQSKLLLPDFASEVYGFLERLHVGISLTANSRLSALLSKLKNRLPVHHLWCKFKEKTTKYGLAGNGAHWLILKHFRRDPSYIDVRRFAIPSAEGAAADCALILRYLSNSHVADLKTLDWDDRFSLKMLAALLVDHNCTLGLLQMDVLDDEPTDYRSLDVVFGGGARLNALHLSISREGLAKLIKRANFLRMSTIQGLTELRLVMKEPTSEIRVGTSCYTVPAKKRQTVVSAPLWIAGIHLLSQCAHYEVKCERHHHSQLIAAELVHVCEKFELGEITQIVERFKFTCSLRVVLPFNARNRIASRTSTVYLGSFGDLCVWEVYRFRNAVIGEWLTACVGQRDTAARWADGFVVHIVKGEVDPDAMYALGW